MTSMVWHSHIITCNRLKIFLKKKKLYASVIMSSDLVWLMLKYVLPPVSVSKSGAPSCEFLFWLHCLRVTLTRTSLPLEGTVKYSGCDAIKMENWDSNRRVQRDGGGGEKRSSLSGTRLCLPLLLQICFSCLDSVTLAPSPMSIQSANISKLSSTELWINPEHSWWQVGISA